MDPARIQFREQVRRLIDDEEQQGLNCKGCLFDRQPARVCRAVEAEAAKRGLRDCDAVDRFGDVVIYVAADTDPRKMNLIPE